MTVLGPFVIFSGPLEQGKELTDATEASAGEYVRNSENSKVTKRATRVAPKVLN
jgi:hypothetical protein